VCCKTAKFEIISDNLFTLAYGYSSMADTDWGWKKRSDEDEEDNGSLNEVSDKLFFVTDVGSK
jgi:hypothetical protein